jgi:hypothetical protein
MWTCLSAHKSIDRVIVVLIQNFMTKAVRLETSLYQVIRVFEPREGKGYVYLRGIVPLTQSWYTTTITAGFETKKQYIIVVLIDQVRNT